MKWKGAKIGIEMEGSHNGWPAGTLQISLQCDWQAREKPRCETVNVAWLWVENFCRSRSNGKAIYSTMQTGPMSNWDAATFTLRPGPVLPCLSLGCKDMFCCIYPLTWTCLHLAWAARTCSAALTLWLGPVSTQAMHALLRLDVWSGPDLNQKLDVIITQSTSSVQHTSNCGMPATLSPTPDLPQVLLASVPEHTSLNAKSCTLHWLWA